MSSGAQIHRKSYAQMCPMANALDIIGDRWTPLILRELLGGPARFLDLHQGLPGIAKNLLTDRLRRLEQDNVLRRHEDSGNYTLTRAGEALRPILEQLAFWGAQMPRATPPKHTRSIRAVAMALQAIVARNPLPCDEPNHWLEVEAGPDAPLEFVLGANPKVTARSCAQAEAWIRVERNLFDRYLNGETLADCDFVLVSGDARARNMLLEALGITQ